MKYTGHWRIETDGFHKGKQFCVVNLEDGNQSNSYIEYGNSKDGLFERIVKQSEWPITKADVEWIDDKSINTNNA
jgi:hypothetical protein